MSPQPLTQSVDGVALPVATRPPEPCTWDSIDYRLLAGFMAGSLAESDEPRAEREAERLWSLALPMARRLAWGCAVSEPDREDAGVRAVEHLFEQLGRFRGKSSLKTYSYRVMLRHIVHEYKRGQKEPGRRRTLSVVQWPAEPFEPVDAKPGPEAKVSGEQLEDEVRHEAEHLSEPFKTAVIRRCVDGLDYPALAREMCAEVGTVREWVCLGRADIRRRLEQKWRIHG